MRVLHPNNRYSHRPYSGRGASLYASVGSGPGVDPGPNSIQFRKIRVLGSRFVRGSGFTIGAGVRKTCALDQINDPTAEFNYTRPLEWFGRIVYVQVRTFWHDVELVSNYDPVRLDFTEAGEIDLAIHGTGYVIAADKRDGGIYRIRFTYAPASHGVQPLLMVIRKTAGPGTLADETTAYLTGQQSYSIDTAALTDGASYTFALVAKNDTVELIVDTITFTADAAGPPAPSGLTLVAT